MLAFAGNSILCRLALASTSIDPASFTSLRLISGAATLWLILSAPGLKLSSAPVSPDKRTFSITNLKTNGAAAVLLFLYALLFSLAYRSLNAGTGAFILFGSVQLAMISVAIIKGERFSVVSVFGFILAFTGLAILLLPSSTAPPFFASLLMIGSGLAWGGYSLLGAKVKTPLHFTMINFMIASAFSLAVSILFIRDLSLPIKGVVYSLVSGAITSGIGYAIWYFVLPHLRSSTSSVIQLSVPVLTVALGILLLNETINSRMLISSSMILAGIFIFTINNRSAKKSS